MSEVKTYIPLAHEERQARQKADLEDRFIVAAVVDAQGYKTWSEFLLGHVELKNLCNDAEHREKFEHLRAQALYNLASRNKKQLDPAAELQKVRERRFKEYDTQNTERRYKEVRDDFLKAAFDGKSWQDVTREREDLTPWDHSLYQRACKEVGLDAEPAAPDPGEEAFLTGFCAD